MEIKELGFAIEGKYFEDGMPIITGVSIVPKDKLVENFKIGKFFNPCSNKPHERHCARLDCAHLERPYRTCDIVPNIQSSKPFGKWDRCYSFEPRKEDGKEESKMSDVKITYKPVDKKDVLRHLLACEDTFRGGDIAAEDMVRKIDSIYNAKEEDGMISSALVRHGDIKLEAWHSEQSNSIRVWLAHDAPNTPGMLEYFSKQEMREFAQALIKMSEQI